MDRTTVVVFSLICIVGCQRRTAESLPHLAEEFVYQQLAFSPSLATQAGYHLHRGANLDEMLDDYSPASVDAQRSFYRQFRERLRKAATPDRLAAEDRADYELISDQISLELLELDEIQSYRHNPTLYVELVGNALFSPYVLEYVPKPQRYRHIISRLRKIPRLVEQAQQNLTDAPEIWNTVACSENEGNIELIDKTLRAGAPESMRAEFDSAAQDALVALRSFNEYLKKDLSKRTSDWRLGRERYYKKFRYVLETELPPSQLRAAAEADLLRIRREMFDLSLPLHHKMYPSHKDPVDLNLIVGETLAKIAEHHTTPSEYVNDAKRDLAEARSFVEQKGLVLLPPRSNLQVIETPEFMRGTYAVGGFVAAPALEPQLGAFYWITPIPKDWPRERVLSKLREYNFYGLKLLTLHEAMPGHYVQCEYANDIHPLWRRLVRSILGNGPYVEGWAIYATQMMLDEGYLNGSPELRLMFLKQQLRMVANAILDIRLQTTDMSDEEAMDLMLNKTFQEKEEATAKLQRAKLSSCQLATYYAGYCDWLRLRSLYQRRKGANFQLAEFHSRALREGAVSLPALARILLGSSLGDQPSAALPSK